MQTLYTLRVDGEPDTVLITHEMIHEVRVIPITGRPHIDDGVRLGMGDDRARWENDRLVVETWYRCSCAGRASPRVRCSDVGANRRVNP